MEKVGGVMRCVGYLLNYVLPSLPAAISYSTMGVAVVEKMVCF